MQLLPKIRARYGEGIGVELFFEYPENQDDEKTYFDADAAAGASSLSANGTNFSVGQWICLGQPGNEKTEIVQIHTATAPTSTTITLAGTTSFAHNRGDLIRFLPYNQIAPEYSTDSAVTWNTITAVNIRSDATETYMQRASDLSTYYYRFRFFNSYSSLYSAYSDQVVATGYPANSLWSIKDRALRQLGEVRGDLITDQFLNDSVLEARRQADYNPAVFRWSFRTKFNSVIGQLLAGQYRIAVPTDLRDPNTYKNILSLRIGNQNRPCVYQDRVRFNQNYLNVVHTTVASAYTHGGTSLVLASTHDLGDTGTVKIANNAYGDGWVSVTFSANNRATNTLTITALASRDIAANTDVWGSTVVVGLPTAYTIDAGYIYFDVPLKIDYDGMDAKGDYYSTIPSMTKDGDTFDEPFYDLYVYFLKWKIKSLKANGKLDRDTDSDYKDWISGLTELIAQETPGQRINFIPDIEGFLSATE